ncbi:hypothetical protein [Thiorhodococcus minor]|uniref:Calcineurin-like phosphoesterase domain-containing protein n=1 Tax=Thiorhodococcus minor TaxID=57489 RepID=A0A6M0K3G3_9GAMM|nr:hypothetical protein [Thiorhodococcus minor]NEV63949.1 hypothetical protein [Thiorhodococcus minor]
MRFRASIWGYLLCTLLCCPSATAEAEGLRFFAVGDLPYRDSEFSQLGLLFDEASVGGAPFLVHLGDIKSGSAPCTDAQLGRIAGLFRAQPLPVLYTPGDNEWTDCHRRRAGGLDPLERLARVRQVFFQDPSVLRLDRLGAVLEQDVGSARTYPEIFSFSRDGVMIVALHVVGSDNNYRARDRRALAEMRARDRANARLLARAGADAEARGLGAMVILMHADPLFERSRTTRGFAAILDALVDLMSAYSGRVLLIHGDTHRLRHDRPLRDRDTGARIDRFERAEVPGSPRVGGLWVSVDPGAVEPFEVAVLYPSSREVLLDQ